MSDDRIVRIEDKIDSIRDDIGKINTVLAAQHESLKEHIRRTSILENELAPIKTHVALSGALAKIIAALGSLILVSEAIVSLLNHIGK